MRRFITLTDIEAAAQQGSNLHVAADDVLTDAARERADELGVVIGAGTTLPPASASAANAPARAQAAPSPTAVLSPRPPATLDLTSVADRLFIGGQWVDARDGGRLTVLDPATNQPLKTIAEAGPADADLAVTAALRALDGPWGRMRPSERAACLYRVADLIEERRDFLAALESRDVGKPIREATQVDLPACWDPFRFFAGVIRQIDGRVLPLGEDRLDYVVREPLGVVGMIIPWNFPLHIACRKASAALAAGNTIVLKPPELAPLSCLELGRIMQEAGVPDGVFNVIPGPGSSTGLALTRDPRVAKIAFTGSTEVGKILMREGAESIKKVSLELGGKSPSLVFADCDLPRAVAGNLFGIYLSQGEVCSASSRLVVQRAVYDEFCERFAERAKSIRVGDPSRWETQMGAVISREALERMERYLQVGPSEGAKLLAGGRRPDDPALAAGNFLLPTVFSDVKNESRLAQEEIFGPIVVIIPFDSEEEGIRLANHSDYGLAAGIWTRDLNRAHRVASKLQAGCLWVNQWGAYPSEAPFGGYKQSGNGHDMGIESLHEYMQVKNVHIDLSEKGSDWYAG